MFIFAAICFFSSVQANTNGQFNEGFLFIFSYQFNETHYKFPVILFLYFFLNIVVFPGKCWQHLGCWTDTWNRAIEGGMESFTDDPINKCHDRAAGKGNTVFAIQATTQCFTAANAGETYTTHGRANNCQDGVGGSWALDVYRITTCSPGTIYIFSNFQCWNCLPD